MRILLLFLILVIPSFAQNPQDIVTKEITIGPLSSEGTTSGNLVLVRNGMAHRHTVQMTISGSPSGCSVDLEGSLDNVTYFSLSGAQDCSANLMFHIANKPVKYIRVNLSSLTGGSNPALTVVYAGEAN